MRKVILLYLILMSATVVEAQVQNGYVKTKGRMGAGGTVIAGARLSGVTVQVKGRNALVTQGNGSFSFPVPSKTYSLETIRKQGYVLTDPEVLTKQYAYSANPLILVLETPQQQAEDKLASERKIRRTLQRQLQQREDELEILREQNKLTTAQYQAAMQKLYDEQASHERLVREMADRYSQIDYDQLDEFNQRISDCILNGRLTEADSLLHSKGDISMRISKLNQQHAANEQVRNRLEKSEEMENIDRQDIARDCYSKFELSQVAHQSDSAAHYIALRASLDTTNVDWQFDAAVFFARYHQSDKAENYYQRVLRLADTYAEGSEVLRATVWNNLALLYASSGRRDDSERWYRQALAVRRQLAQANPEVYEPDLAVTLNNLATLYAGDPQRQEQAETLYLEALQVRRRLATRDSDRYLPDVAVTLGNLADLYAYSDAHTHEAERMYREAIGIYQQQAGRNSETLKADMAMMQNNLGIWYFHHARLDEARESLMAALTAYCRLAKDCPQVYDRFVEPTLSNMDNLLQQMELDGDYYQAGEQLYRFMAAYQPETYEPAWAEWLNTYADYLDKAGKPDEVEQCYQQAMDVYRRWAKKDAERFRPYIARTLGNLSFHALLQKDFVKAEQLAREGLKTDSSKVFIQANLAAALLFQGKDKEAYRIYTEYQNQLRSSFLDDFDVYEQKGIIPGQAQKHVEHLRQMLQ